MNFQTGYSWNTTPQSEGHVSSNFHTRPINNIETQKIITAIQPSNTSASTNHWNSIITFWINHNWINQSLTTEANHNQSIWSFRMLSPEYSHQNTKQNPELCNNKQKQLKLWTSCFIRYTLLPYVEPACIRTFTKGNQRTDMKISIYYVYATLICWTSVYTLFY